MSAPRLGITRRLLPPILLISALVAAACTFLQGRQEHERLKWETRQRAIAAADTLRGAIEAVWPLDQPGQLHALLDRLRDSAAALYTADGARVAGSSNLPEKFLPMPGIVRDAIHTNQRTKGIETDNQRWWYVQALPVRVNGAVRGGLLFLSDLSPSEAAFPRLWRQALWRVGLPALLIALLIFLIIQRSVIRPLTELMDWMRRVRTGGAERSGPVPRSGIVAPLTREVTHLARSLLAARLAAAEEARLRHQGESRWTPERLNAHVRTVIQGRPLIVVSNREPYMHVRQGKALRYIVPPGGLVTALEPVLRACSGTWIAAGTGEADREAADEHGRLRVPPEAPRYTLRRVWLQPDEERGYYYGFANEGLWPLCHITHTRPLFRAEDWTHYARVNAKFADAVVDELAGTADEPFVLIQDYHFALLPRLIKERRPDARIALFWHIPWPNPESFGICPWARELLEGMLGADIIGFHIQFFCNNFLESVDRTLESRLDWEHFAVNRAEQTTLVKPFPISIAWPDAPAPTTDEASPRTAIAERLGLTARWLGVGVDRLDYTKGLPERLLALERFLEKYPEFQGQFTYIELGAPSRSLLPRYQELEAALVSETDRINRRFHTKSWTPVVFLKKQHSHDEILPFYQAADVCLVTSLHDGMNLVSKEFVAARRDGQGVLILSQFTGASRELRDALIVNPYDIEQMADALHTALTMPPEEQRARMARMRDMLQTHDVYRWAAGLITELANIRLEAKISSAPTREAE
ncbi:MAG: trehalose-6-phosphate synthase [Candidatus Omnitrophica bacterium]|nr:trehalose-6-phosphate synthase [Candidatus Omnitrophota bacterium]